MGPRNPLIALHWWRQRNPASHRQHINHPFPRAASLDSDMLSSTSTFHQADIMEKAMICPYRPSRPQPIVHDFKDPKSMGLFGEKPTSTSTPSPRAIESPLPTKRYISIIRRFRYTIFTMYQRLFSLVLFVNLAGIIFYLLNPHHITLKNLSTWASTNFFVAIIVRQDFFTILIFRAAWLIPWCVPMRIRQLCARVYMYGGIHSGAAVAGTMWWTAITALTTARYVQTGAYLAHVVVLTWAIELVLIIIILFACPHIRAAAHNSFEMTHRFGGWVTVMLFWIHLVLLSLSHHKSSQTPHPIPLSTSLLHNPTFWNLILITALLIHPWLMLRKHVFRVEPLSDHAMRLHFTFPVHRFSCLVLSSSPWREWHPFATFPTFPELDGGEGGREGGGSMVVSRAGDWTGGLIDGTRSHFKSNPSPHQTRDQTLNEQTPTHTLPPTSTPTPTPSPPRTISLYTRGHPRPGVLSLTLLFSRLIIITTGSGIGPCLSSFLERPAGQFIRLIWSAPSPLTTFGPEIVGLVKRLDKGARVFDTRREGRQDLVRVAMEEWGREKEGEGAGFEAVFVLGNRGVTEEVVRGLGKRGVRVFAPVWDS